MMRSDESEVSAHGGRSASFPTRYVENMRPKTKKYKKDNKNKKDEKRRRKDDDSSDSTDRGRRRTRSNSRARRRARSSSSPPRRRRRSRSSSSTSKPRTGKKDKKEKRSRSRTPKRTKRTSTGSKRGRLDDEDDDHGCDDGRRRQLGDDTCWALAHLVAPEADVSSFPNDEWGWLTALAGNTTIAKLSELPAKANLPTHASHNKVSKLRELANGLGE